MFLNLGLDRVREFAVVTVCRIFFSELLETAFYRDHFYFQLVHNALHISHLAGLHRLHHLVGFSEEGLGAGAVFFCGILRDPSLCRAAQQE